MLNAHLVYILNKHNHIYRINITNSIELLIRFHIVVIHYLLCDVSIIVMFQFLWLYFLKERPTYYKLVYEQLINFARLHSLCCTYFRIAY